MIITLGGLPGAGKSTIKNLLATELGLKTYSMGDMRGKMATERGMTIDELNEIGMHDPSTDREIDEYQTKLGTTEDNFIIDGAMSWHFIPHSKKVFLTVDPQAAAERIFNDRKSNPNRADEPDYADAAATAKALAARIEHNVARYQKWYGVSYLDTKNYDLVIDTTRLTTAEVIEQILAFVR